MCWWVKKVSPQRPTGGILFWDESFLFADISNNYSNSLLKASLNGLTHFATLQKYTGDSTSSTVNEHITLNFKGTKMFLTRWRPSPVGVSCCASVQLLLHVWLHTIWIKQAPSPSCFSLSSLKVIPPVPHTPPQICVRNCSLTQFNQNETG